MKKVMTMLGVAGMAVSSFAAVNDTLINFSTPGPDVYGDGTAVLPGECYALVWSADGVFDGINADGTPADPNDRVVLVANVAQRDADGKGFCPPVIYQVDAAEAEQLEGGQYAVYLLDTRIVAADGSKTVGGLDGNGRLKLVNTGVAVGEDMAASHELGESATVSAKAVVSYSVDCYAKVEKPTITGIDIGNATITITATGFSPVAKYWLVKGNDPGNVSTKVSEVEFDKNGVCTFDKPAEKFFRIEGGYKVEINK